MEWFKHYTNAHDDPIVSAAWDKFGDPGYIVWFVLLELYGGQFNYKKPGDGLTISIKQIAKKCRKSVAKVSQILRFYEGFLKISLKNLDERGLMINVKINKFAEIASNWTKRKIITPTEAPTEAPTAREKSKSKSKSKNPPIVPPKVPNEKILKLYHSELPMLKNIKVWDKTARSNLKARWREKPEHQCLDFWENYFNIVKGCSFLLGNNDRGWKADLRWLVNASNFAKVMNGNYEDTENGGIYAVPNF